jgi:hypothetical protein
MRVTFWQIISRGLRRRCPNCGERLIFGRRMQLPERCPHCAARWDRGNGFFLGAVVWNYSVTVFGLMLMVALAALRGWLSPGLAIGLGLGIGLLFPLAFYKWSWSLWLASYYCVLPNELPANAGQKHPALRQ